MLSTSSSLLAPKQPPSARAMTYDPYLTNSTSASGEGKVPEFLRPLPKPAARYTGESPAAYLQSYGGGVRMVGGGGGKLAYPPPPQHHPQQPHPDEQAVNLMQKHPAAVYQFPPLHAYQFPAHAYTPLYFNAAMPHQFSLQQPVQQQQAQQQPPQQVRSFAYQAKVQQQQQPPPPIQQTSLLLHDPRPPPPPHHQQQQLPLRTPPQHTPPQAAKSASAERPPFKVPSGKEGSLKHRILTRPEPSTRSPGGHDRPPKSQFSRGSLIKLGTERLIRIEDMRTEDFVLAAERCPALRLDPSTIVRISESAKRPHEASILLRYGSDQQQQTVELEVLPEHPFFVYGKGWSSVSPERSLSCYDLPCLRLTEGDTCISLSPRAGGAPEAAPPTSAAALKRRWSAPAENGLPSDEDCSPQPPAPQRTRH